jgi:putative serine protease PepD
MIRHGTGRQLAALTAAGAIAGAGVGVGLAATSSSGTDTSAAVSATPAAATSLTPAQIYVKDVRSIVEITATTTAQGGGPFGGVQTATAEGSGFVYDTRGDIVTNEHVVHGATSIAVKLADGTTRKATLLGSDASSDLAVVRVSVPASKLHPLALADSSTISVGDPVVAIGSPYGLENSITAGIVSGPSRTISAPDRSSITDAIQTDAAINPGNSGGPLLDSHGDAIGVTSQIESDSGGNDGVGFAIPSNTVKAVVAKLLAGSL